AKGRTSSAPSRKWEFRATPTRPTASRCSRVDTRSERGSGRSPGRCPVREQGASFALAKATLGGRKLGPATALVDEDVLRVLLVDAGGGEKAIQLRYDSIVGVGLGDGSVVVACRDGRDFVAATKEAATFRQSVLAACRAL